MKGQKTMKNVSRGNGSPYALYDKTIEKTIKTLTGGEVTRKAHVRVAVPETMAEVNALCHNNEEVIAKWVALAMITHARVVANNALTGVISGGDKKLTRQFNESLRTLVEVLEMSREDAIAKLIKTPQFAIFQAKIESLSNTSTLELDYYADGLPEPKWFSGDDEDEEETIES